MENNCNKVTCNDKKIMLKIVYSVNTSFLKAIHISKIYTNRNRGHQLKPDFEESKRF